MPLIKDIRFLILLGLTLISIYLVVSPYFFKQSGVIVSSLDKNINCTSVKEGDIILEVGGNSIKNGDEFKKAVKNFKEGDYVTLIVNNMPGNCYIGRNGSVGINVVDVQSTKTIFGMEFQGGVRFVLVPEKNISQAVIDNLVGILDKRMKNLGLLQGTVKRWDEKINVTTLTEEKIGMLIAPGELQGVVSEEIKLQNNVGKLFVGNKTYSIDLLENKIKILNSSYGVKEYFKVDNISFEVKNITNSSVLLEAIFLENEDVKSTVSGETVSYNSNSRKYEYAMPVEIKNETAERFINIVKKLPITSVGNKNLFNAFMRFYFDGKLLSQLSIPSDIIDKEIRVLSVIGSADSRNEANNDLSKIHASITGGTLPERLKIEYSERVEAGSRDKLVLMLFGGLTMLIFILAMVYLLSKSIKTGLVFDILILMELVSMFGLVIINQTYLGVGWLVDYMTLWGLLVLMLVISIEMFINVGYSVKSDKYRSVFNKTRYMSVLIMIFGVCLFFTGLKNLGLVLFFGELLHALLVKSIYTNEIKKF